MIAKNINTLHKQSHKTFIFQASVLTSGKKSPEEALPGQIQEKGGWSYKKQAQKLSFLI